MTKSEQIINESALKLIERGSHLRHTHADSKEKLPFCNLWMLPDYTDRKKPRLKNIETWVAARNKVQSLKNRITAFRSRVQWLWDTREMMLKWLNSYVWFMSNFQLESGKASSIQCERWVYVCGWLGCWIDERMGAVCTSIMYTCIAHSSVFFGTWH